MWTQSTGEGAGARRTVPDPRRIVLTVGDARSNVLDVVRVPDPAQASLIAALDRLLVGEVVVGYDMPPADYLSIDGFALRAADRRAGIRNGVLAGAGRWPRVDRGGAQLAPAGARVSVFPLR